jgi:hypothetical protein
VLAERSHSESKSSVGAVAAEGAQEGTEIFRFDGCVFTALESCLALVTQAPEIIQMSIFTVEVSFISPKSLANDFARAAMTALRDELVEHSEMAIGK